MTHCRYFIPHERAITLLLWYQQWLVGDAPFPLNVKNLNGGLDPYGKV